MKALLPELWFEISSQCTPLSLFFLYDTCESWRKILDQNFAILKLCHCVPDATSYEELVYFLSLREKEQVAYCVSRDWSATFELLPVNDKLRHLQFMLPTHGLLYPNHKLCNKTPVSYAYEMFSYEEKARFLLTITSELYESFCFHIPERDYHKLPLNIQRNDIEDGYRSSFYWALTGNDLFPNVEKGEWQLCRDFVASNGKTECPDIYSEFFEALYYHGSKKILLKYGDFGCDCREERNTTVVFERKLFTQDEFFSYLQREDVVNANYDWCRYFASRGMEDSYLRYKALDLFCDDSDSMFNFLEHGNLHAFFRHWKKGDKLNTNTWSVLENNSELMQLLHS